MNIDSVVGYTGPRTGMESAQLTTVAAILIEWGPTEVHHGICVGGDEQFHKLVRSLFGRDIVIVGHPCNMPDQQAEQLYRDCDVLEPVLPPLTRNANIVLRGGRFIATPNGYTQRLRSGTWSTIRAIERARKMVCKVWPDGTATL
jgi:hypothetical protein